MEGEITALSVDQSAGIAASYARTNLTVRDLEPTTLDAQEAGNVARAEALGYHVPELYRLREIASGLDPNPPVRAELHRLVANKEVQCVFVDGLDRLSRNVLEVAKFYRHCKEHGVLVEFNAGR